MNTILNYNLLEQKLKRHKISCVIKNNKILIGKPKLDWFRIIGLIIFPFIIFIAGILFVTLNDREFFFKIMLRFILVELALLSIVVLNTRLIFSKMRSNDNIKILQHNCVKISNTNHLFDLRNIKEFVFYIKQIEDNVFLGNLFLIDIDDQEHLLLGIEDEEEKYVINDLKWLSNFFLEYIKR